MSARVYRKHQSFVELRQKRPLADARERVQAVLEAEGDYGLGERRAALVRAACRELLGQERPANAEPFVLHPNAQEEVSRLDDAELPRYLHYRYRYETYPARRILDDYPPLVQIEPTSICNFRCVFCYQTDKPFTRKSNGHMGTMTLDTFKRVADELVGNVEAVTLASRGEPLLCPDLPAMLAYAGEKFLALKVNTNASLLNEKMCHALLGSGIQTLVFSADAAAEPAYSKLRVGGSLERTLRNVALFHEIRAKSYPKSRMITRVSGVKVPGSGELDQMERFWGDYVDQVAFVAYNPWEDAYHAAPTGIETPCSDLWRRLFIWWDGGANPCDVDFKSELSVGSATNASVSSLWRSQAYEGLRLDHIEKRRASRTPCAGCAFV